LAVAEVKNQQLSEQLAQANARVADLDKENQANVCKLQETMETGQRLESELMAAKAVVVSHEKIFENSRLCRRRRRKASTQRIVLTVRIRFLIQRSRRFSGNFS
jgi:hypothetical protein